ncbi:hypothetical protein BZL54_21480 [Burkholderia ubonensis subsp. mesacidophila]|uniref:Uncharacterized protein n=1 Tax=Burkholderia ubonensis subsp. mesacidophila TaxID=265293 RepID=A0A2A4FCD6_9BURK|nr:hypothetical protein BZL54_21480 [Burkholderia ubonensis subsp. mesacidophila]
METDPHAHISFEYVTNLEGVKLGYGAGFAKYSALHCESGVADGCGVTCGVQVGWVQLEPLHEDGKTIS